MPVRSTSHPGKVLTPLESFWFFIPLTKQINLIYAAWRIRCQMQAARRARVRGCFRLLVVWAREGLVFGGERARALAGI